MFSTNSIAWIYLTILQASWFAKRSRMGTRTTVIITHDKDLQRLLEPRIVMLHEGRVFFDGPYRSFEQSDSRAIQLYFDLMPGLHQRERSA